jgi:hypothetical protein
LAIMLLYSIAIVLEGPPLFLRLAVLGVGI